MCYRNQLEPMQVQKDGLAKRQMNTESLLFLSRGVHDSILSIGNSGKLMQ